MKKSICIKLIGLFFLFSYAYAANLTNLYEIELPLVLQTEDMKEQAVRDGFLQVLIRLSGNSRIDANPVIHAALQRADYYVQDYTYLPVTTDASEYHIQVRYDPEDVNRLLAAAGVFLWGEKRPLVLVWLAVKSKQQNFEIVSNEGENAILTTLKQRSKVSGLPLIFPIMDVTDMSEVAPNDVIDMSLPILKDAARRYSPDALLIGRMQESDTGWTSNWELIVGVDEWSFTLDDKSSDTLIESVMNEASQLLAKRYTTIKTQHSLPTLAPIAMLKMSEHYA